MMRIAVTQRVDIVPGYGERRDALDQNWTRFLERCGAVPVLMPNVRSMALALVADQRIDGLLLTGGNDLQHLGGAAPERDETEQALLQLALQRQMPVIGVCRGMQVLQATWGVRLVRVSGHVTASHDVTLNGARDAVNSFHNFGSIETAPELEVWARAEDGVVEAVRHTSAPVVGMMWHPERYAEFRALDIEMFRTTWSKS